MAHNLATTNGQTAMMYTRKVPSHRPGTKLNEPATAREALEASGLNYPVELKSLVTTEGTAVPQRKGVVRSDTGDVGNSTFDAARISRFEVTRVAVPRR